MRGSRGGAGHSRAFLSLPRMQMWTCEDRSCAMNEDVRGRARQARKACEACKAEGPSASHPVHVWWIHHTCPHISERKSKKGKHVMVCSRLWCATRCDAFTESHRCRARSTPIPAGPQRVCSQPFQAAHVPVQSLASRCCAYAQAALGLKNRPSDFQALWRPSGASTGVTPTPPGRKSLAPPSASHAGWSLASRCGGTAGPPRSLVPCSSLAEGR